MRPEDVPAGPLLMDTDVFRYLFTGKGRNEEFAPLLEGHLLCMSFATYAEALSIGCRSNLGSRKMDDLRSALRKYLVLPYDKLVAEKWAPMHAKVSGHLHNGGCNDLWTAACALAQPEPLPVVTNNLGDFTSIAAHFPIKIVHPDLS